MIENKVKIAVIYHSSNGHTAIQAKYVADGVKESGVGVAHLVDINAQDRDKTFFDVLTNCDGIIFGSPTYMGSVSGEFKKFMDETSSIWLNRGFENKIAGGFTNSSSESGDKLNTLIQIMIFAMQHGMIWVGSDEMPSGCNKQGRIVNREGSYVGAMVKFRSDLDIESDNIKLDLALSHSLGKRIALITSSNKFSLIPN